MYGPIARFDENFSIFFAIICQSCPTQAELVVKAWFRAEEKGDLCNGLARDRPAEKESDRRLQKLFSCLLELTSQFDHQIAEFCLVDIGIFLFVHSGHHILKIGIL